LKNWICYCTNHGTNLDKLLFICNLIALHIKTIIRSCRFFLALMIATQFILLSSVIERLLSEEIKI